jgi:hypothetical protein
LYGFGSLYQNLVALILCYAQLFMAERPRGRFVCKGSSEQGDHIGRIFAYRAIVYFGSFLLI